ncbi:GNAT family protein [Actinomadura sp. DC4]|uniref:GNAT family N-acetyltransferase n=1 Tax=Actinomadura sp. DC4 TaxID=3055069 RepID=UPI0025B1A8F4|nr:GNAT family protein [Actinomadura sp. DC4]MDN3357431.1 GNAT family protein [Actinomadura sp. DC4]
MFAHPLADDAELRPLEPWHAEEFSAHADRSREHLAPWLPWVEVVNDADSARRWLQSYADRQARDEGRLYGIWVGGVLSGGTLFRVFDTRSRTCEVGVWLSPEARGRGLITTAARHMIDWAVVERGMTRVEWRTLPANEASKAVARRLGMTREGVLRASFPLRGGLHDTEVWALLADEWTA